MVNASDGMFGSSSDKLLVLICSVIGNMIYVNIQYRLGLFGFLSGSQVAADGVLNAGLLDQRAALDWTQRNIRAFGRLH